jgi:hypothetical protein
MMLRLVLVLSMVGCIPEPEWECEDGLSLTPSQGSVLEYWVDIDEDGFGDQENPVWMCSELDGYVLAGEAEDHDCDDNDAEVNPGQTEVCDDDDTDEDCNGTADDMLSNIVDIGIFCCLVLF